MLDTHIFVTWEVTGVLTLFTEKCICHGSIAQRGMWEPIFTGDEKLFIIQDGSNTNENE